MIFLDGVGRPMSSRHLGCSRLYPRWPSLAIEPTAMVTVRPSRFPVKVPMCRDTEGVVVGTWYDSKDGVGVSSIFSVFPVWSC